MVRLDSYYENKPEREIVYIGSSINLKNRLNSHEVVKVLKAMFTYSHHITIHFKETLHFKEYEKQLIRHFSPRINRQNA